MSLETYFFNLSPDGFGWILSFDQPSRVDAPIWSLNDNRDFGIVFCKRVSVSTVEKVPDVVSVRMGLKNGATTLEPAATAGPPDNYEFPFLLPMSGTNMDALMTGVTTPQRVDAEFEITTARGGPNTFRTHIYVAPKILSAAVPDPSVAEPATTISEVSGIFVAKEPPVGSRMIWTDETTGQKYSVGFRDGQFHADLLT
jgi:hypothetical protein